MKLTLRPTIFLLFFISVVTLFLSFNKNVWQAAEKNWFDTHELDMESYIAGRLAKSRQDGVFSAGGLTGVGSFTSTPVDYGDMPFGHQYEAYMHGLSFGAYTSYNSQIGGQGIFFSILDRILERLGDTDGQEKFSIFHFLTSFCAAVMLSCIIVWFHLEFGLKASLLVLFSTLFSPWLVVFGRNLWWALGFFYLPFCAILYYLRYAGSLSNVSLLKIAGITGVSVFIKCLFNGYEYITTTLIMMVVPIVYYYVLYSAKIRQALKVLGVMALASVLAIFISFAILCVQIGSVKGHFSDGIHHIIYSFDKRTYGDPTTFSNLPSQEQQGLKAELWPVLETYLNGTFLDLNIPLASFGLRSGDSLPISYWHLIALFGVASIYIYICRNPSLPQDERRRYIALISATWFSILAPLSWFVIFKAHSYVHPHMNFLVWHMPFVLFGFALSGVAAKNLASDLIPRKIKPPAPLTGDVPIPIASDFRSNRLAVFTLDEIVVSLPLSESEAPYHNLHIVLGFLIDPIRQSALPEREANVFALWLEPRICSAVATVIQEQGPQTLSATGNLRNTALAEAGIVLAKALDNWPYAADYTIQLMMTNIYWTDSSVGKKQKVG